MVAREGNLPPLFYRHNRHGSPGAVLLIQVRIGTIISLLYVFLPFVNQAFWLLPAMTVELLGIVYFLVFAAVIKLRYSAPATPRAFTIPGGLTGVWIVGGIGAFRVIFTFIIGLIPPGLIGYSGVGYVLAVLAGTLLLAVPPLIFIRLKKPGWLEGEMTG